MVGVGSLNDGSKNAVWPLELEDEFRRIMKIAVRFKGSSVPFHHFTKKPSQECKRKVSTAIYKALSSLDPALSALCASCLLPAATPFLTSGP